MLDLALAPYNALVQKTCAGDLEGGADPDGCFRAECAVRAWAPGTFEVRDTTVDVTCTDAEGSPRDTAFRVYFGQEAFTSQGSWEGGFRYGWLNFDLPPGESGCLEGDALPEQVRRMAGEAERHAEEPCAVHPDRATGVDPLGMDQADRLTPQ